MNRGVHPSEVMMYFVLPVSDFAPLFSKIFGTFWKLSKVFPFPEKISHFHPPKFLTTFCFSHRPQISDFLPYFTCFRTFPPWFAKIYNLPLFPKFPPCFPTIQQFFTYFTCIFPLL